MSNPETFQLSVDAAERYESAFVPALFGAWAPLLVDAARVRPGQTVLDVGCGTGVVAREAARRLAGSGRVIGCDLNEAMLAVAARVAPGVEWQRGDMCALPFPDAFADTVLCQAALMFVTDPEVALREMARVVRRGGTVGVQVWGSADAQRGWAPFYDVVRGHAGDDAVHLLDTYWRLGDVPSLVFMCERAGLVVEDVATHEGSAAFPSVQQFVTAEVAGTPLQERLDEHALELVVGDVGHAMAPFQAADGHLDVPIQGHVVVATRGDS